MSHTYQQFVLLPAAKKLLTVNTRKGLFQSTCLQLGVHSASDIFQSEMGDGLSKVPFAKVRSNNTLISGKNGYIQILKIILYILKKSSLSLKF